MGKRKYKIEKCSKCGSLNTHLRKWDTGHGSREYHCNDCRRCFSIRFKPNKKPVKIKQIAPPKPIKLVKPLQYNKLELSVDSILDVVCFMCTKLSLNCDVVECIKLSKSLGAPAILIVKKSLMKEEYVGEEIQHRRRF